MRFMVMHKVGPRMESGQVRPDEITNMVKFMGDSFKAGVATNGAGLKPSATRSRLTFQGGECTVKHGPYQGRNELLAGFAMIKVKNRDEAVQWAHRFAKVVGDVELELGPITEAWDIGLAPKPTGEVPQTFLLLNMADANTEAGVPPPERELKDRGVLLEAMKKAGVLLAAEGLRPSAKGMRLQFKDGQRRTVVDGPFAESKELIAGFTILQVPTRAAALEWATRYGEILFDLEVDLRELLRRRLLSQ